MPTSNKTIAKHIRVAVVFLLIILVVLFVFLIREYRSLVRENVIQTREWRLSAFLSRRGPLTANDVGIVQPWMTFDYINKIFNLPADYLKNRLAVTDGRYPKLSIGTYVKNNRLEINTFMNSLIQALTEHFQLLGNSSST